MRSLCLALSCLLLLVACSGDDSPSAAPLTAATSAATPQNDASTPLPTTAVTATPAIDNPPEALTLALWWPDALNPGDRAEVNDIINAQINGFVEAEEDETQVDFRLKRYGSEQGAIMPTLRTASGVAPGALPDLTLIRRSDLVAAVDAGLVYPLDGIVSASTIASLYSPALRMGQIGDTLYGLPYLVDIQHIVYSAEALENAELTTISTAFDDVIEAGIPLLMPTRRPNSINLTFYAQYLTAGGLQPEQDQTLTLDVDALAAVLTFYEALYRAGLLDEAALDYTSINDYAAIITSGGTFDSALVSSNLYLSEIDAENGMVAASIATADGQPTGVMSGWVWVMTTGNTERQALVGRFLNWMMEAGRQAEFAGVIRMLPSQPRALRDFPDERVPVTVYDAMLSGAIIAPPEPFATTVARTLQTAFMNVITGEESAEDAVAWVVEQLNDD